MPLKFLIQEHHLFLKRGMVLGSKAAKLHGWKKQLSCCVDWKAFGKEWNGDAWVLSVKFYNCKRKENRLCKSLCYDGNTCKRRSVWWKMVIWNSFSSHLNFTSLLLPEMSEVNFQNGRWGKKFCKSYVTWVFSLVDLFLYNQYRIREKNQMGKRPLEVFWLNYCS